jgi:hypothetical protein
MNRAGVTTILPLTHASNLQQMMVDATGLGYYPEWIATNYLANDYDTSSSGLPKDQSAHLFGLMSWDKILPESQMPYYWAGKEMDPNYTHSGNATGFNNATYSMPYWNMLLLASGIQMAGPNLTPQTFQQGLQRTAFPNPGCAAPPYYQACVGFYPDGHSMMRDFAPVWWDNSQFTYQAGANYQHGGAFCYAYQGKRFGLGAWPNGPIPFFQPPCR